MSVADCGRDVPASDVDDFLHRVAREIDDGRRSLVYPESAYGEFPRGEIGVRISTTNAAGSLTSRATVRLHLPGFVRGPRKWYSSAVAQHRYAESYATGWHETDAYASTAALHRCAIESVIWLLYDTAYASVLQPWERCE